MLLKLKKMFGTDLVKVSFLNGIATLLRMLTGFISIKLVARLLEPAGIALLGQLNNFSTIIMSLSAGGINTGMTKHIAQYSDSDRKTRLFLSTGFRITAFLSIICGLVLIFGAGHFSRTILKSNEYKPIFYIFGCTIILYAFNAFLVAILNGFREFKKYVSVNIAGSITGLLFTVVLSFSFGVMGALIALVTYQSVIFVVTLSMVTSSKWFRWDLFLGGFSKVAALRLGRFSLMALVSAIAVPSSQLIVRNHIAGTSLTNAGLWEGMNRISGLYLLVITTSLSVYFLPKLAALKTRWEIRNEIMSVYKLVIPFMIISSMIIFLFRDIVIAILFTEKFQGMQGLFAFQLLGDLFKVAAWVLGYVLLAKAMTKEYIIVEIASCTLFALLSMFFVNVYGTIGATIGYACSFFLHFVIMVFVLRKILFNHAK